MEEAAGLRRLLTLKCAEGQRVIAVAQTLTKKNSTWTVSSRRCARTDRKRAHALALHDSWTLGQQALLKEHLSPASPKNFLIHMDFSVVSGGRVAQERVRQETLALQRKLAGIVPGGPSREERLQRRMVQLESGAWEPREGDTRSASPAPRARLLTFLQSILLEADCLFLSALLGKCKGHC